MRARRSPRPTARRFYGRWRACARIQTVAEMVETEDEAKFLIDARVEYGQGYLFGKPGPGITAIHETPATR